MISLIYLTEEHLVHANIDLALIFIRDLYISYPMDNQNIFRISNFSLWSCIF